jgi:membrane fusion protein, multidrug efflux system
VYFDIDENTVLRVRRAVNEGKIQRYQQGEIPVFIGLEGEEGYPHEGNVNFVNNQVNPGTASITVRGVVQNAKPDKGVRLLSPGMFVRVRLPIGQPHDALLVIDRAIGSDQGMKYVYVIDDKNVVQQRRIETAALQEDGLRVIDSGLKPTDWVVIGGIQQVRPRMTVIPDHEPMPTLGAVSEGLPSEGNGATGSSKGKAKGEPAASGDSNGKSTKATETPKLPSDKSHSTENPPDHSESGATPASAKPNPTKTD